MSTTKSIYLGDVFGGLDEDGKLVLGQTEHSEGLYNSDGGRNKLYAPLPPDEIEIKSLAQPDEEILLDKNSLTLLDRPYLEPGVQVSKNGKVGVISAKRQVVAVRLINADSYLVDVPADRLVEISGTKRYREVLLDDFIGDIQSPVHKVSLAFPSGSTCNISYEADNELFPGSLIRVGLWKLRQATNWNGSRYLRSWRVIQNAGSVATVTGIEVESLKVQWRRALPPSESEDFPPEMLTGQKLGEVKYLPWRSEICSGAVRRLELNDEDLQNVIPRENCIDHVLRRRSNDNEEENGEGPAARRQKLDNLVVGSLQSVEILLVQNIVEITFQTGEKEEMASIDIDEIQTLNSIDIPMMEYVVRTDQKEFGHFGLCTEYYPGECEDTPKPMNPKLNPQNMKQVHWFAVVDAADPRRVEPMGTEVMSVYDIESLNLSHALQNSGYLTRGCEDTEFSAGTFSKILDNGMIEIKDLNGSIMQKWPTQIEINPAGLLLEDLLMGPMIILMPEPYKLIPRICELPTQVNVEDFLRAEPLDIDQMDRIVQIPTAPLESTGMHPDGGDFQLQKMALQDSMNQILEPRYNGLWIQQFDNYPEQYLGFMVGQVDSIVEDVLFKIDIYFYIYYFSSILNTPAHGRVQTIFNLDLLSPMNEKLLPHWIELQNTPYRRQSEIGGSENTILNGLLILRDNIQSTNLATVKDGDSGLTFEEIYPHVDLTAPEQLDWHNRWKEVIGIQSIRYVFNSIAHPSGLHKDLVLGHYRHKLVGLLNRWNDWRRQNGQLFTAASPGFVTAVGNQLKRFEPFTTTQLVRNPAPLPRGELDSQNDLPNNNDPADVNPTIDPPANSVQTTNSLVERVGRALGWANQGQQDPRIDNPEAVEMNENQEMEESEEIPVAEPMQEDTAEDASVADDSNEEVPVKDEESEPQDQPQENTDTANQDLVGESEHEEPGNPTDDAQSTENPDSDDTVDPISTEA